MQLRSISLLLILLLGGGSDLARAGETHCVHDGSIRYSLYGKTVVRHEPFCVHEKSMYFTSLRCHLNREKCLATQMKILPKLVQRTPSQTGNPIFKYCLLVSGTPMLIEYSSGQTWTPLSICQFRDKSIIGLDYLARNFIDFK